MHKIIVMMIASLLFLGCSQQAQDVNTAAPVKNSAPLVVEGRNADQWQSSDSDVSFRISTEKKTYSVSDRVTVRAELRNTEKVDVSALPVHVAFGNAGDAIRISGPKEVRYRGPFKSMPPPKTVVLSAGTTTTAEAAIDDRYEGFGVEGEYKITCSFSGMTSTVVITLIDKKE